jgi:sugar porter (SP) family MFS transporter
MSEVTSYMGLRGPALSSVIGATAGLAFFLFGYDQGDLAGLLTVPSFRKQFPQADTIGFPESAHVANLQGLTVGIWNLGCFVSAILTIFLGDRIGRKKTMLMGLTFLAIGEIIQASSYSWSQFLVGRSIAGFGNGFNTATVPAWQAECTKVHRRGTLLMVTAGTFIAAGLSFSYWMDFAFAWLEPSSAAWRIPIAIQLIFLLVAALLLLVMPESPRWLILTGRENEALKVLSALNDKPIDSHDVRMEFLQIKDAVIEMSKGTFGSAFSMGDYRHVHRTCLAVLLQVFQQMTGINLITQFLALMFVQLYGYSGWVGRLLGAVVGTAFTMASVIPVVGIDRFWGRRSLMMFSAGGMSICMAILSAMLWLQSSSGNIVSTVFIFLYVSFFACGFQGIAWLLQVELVPLRIRGPANAMSTAANWLVNYAVIHRLPHLHHLRGFQLRHRPHRLLLLSGDRLPQSRRNRRHLLQRKPAAQALAQRGQDRSRPTPLAQREGQQRGSLQLRRHRMAQEAPAVQRRGQDELGRLGRRDYSAEPGQCLRRRQQFQPDQETDR